MRRAFRQAVGAGTLSAALGRNGAAAVGVDRWTSPALDICSQAVQRLIRGWIKGGCLVGFWIAPPGDFESQPRAVCVVGELLTLAQRRGALVYIEGWRDATRWQSIPSSDDGCLLHTFDGCAWSGRLRHPSIVMNWGARRISIFAVCAAASKLSVALPADPTSRNSGVTGAPESFGKSIAEACPCGFAADLASGSAGHLSSSPGPLCLE